MDAEKERHMQLRRASGTRRLPPVEGPPVRERQGPTYRVAHACFACRKTFKRAPTATGESTCPHCAGTLHAMGRSFKAPRRDDLEQWAKVKALYDAGFRFWSYGRRNCEDTAAVPPLPARLSEVEAFIRDNPEHPSRLRSLHK